MYFVVLSLVAILMYKCFGRNTVLIFVTVGQCDDHFRWQDHCREVTISGGSTG